jgi:hypothetical protein
VCGGNTVNAGQETQRVRVPVEHGDQGCGPAGGKEAAEDPVGSGSSTGSG